MHWNVVSSWDGNTVGTLIRASINFWQDYQLQITKVEISAFSSSPALQWTAIDKPIGRIRHEIWKLNINLLNYNRVAPLLQYYSDCNGNIVCIFRSAITVCILRINFYSCLNSI